MGTYDINSLTLKDGTLYSNGVAVDPRDVIASYAPQTENEVPSFLGGSAPVEVATKLPAWAAIQHWGDLIPKAPEAEYSFMGLGNAATDPYANARALGSQLTGLDKYKVDPFLEFTNTGMNRNLLYGGYGNGSVSGYTLPDQEPNILGYLGAISSGSFDRHSAIPDLSTYAGEEYVPSGEMVNPISQRSAQEAQAILKKFYPNATQEQLDRAAYAALQSPDRYYSAAATQQSPEQYYYGNGPLVAVRGIAHQLGGITPELQTFLDQNNDKYALGYAGARQKVKSALRAEDGSGLGSLGGLAKMALGVAGLATGMPWLGAIGSLTDGFQPTDLLSFASAAGGFGGIGGDMNWDLGSALLDLGDSADWDLGSALSGLGDTVDDLGSNWDLGSALSDLGATVDDLDLYTTTGPTEFPDWAKEWMSTDSATASPEDWGPNTWLNELKARIPNLSTSDAVKLLKAISSSGGGEMPWWMKAIAGAVAGGGKQYYANKNNAAAQGALTQTQNILKSGPYAQGLTPKGSLGSGAWTPHRMAASGGSMGQGRSTQREAAGYLQGDTGGQDDVIPVQAAAGEYVFDADVVSALGDGNNAAGAGALDKMREHIRKHKRSAPAHKIPPKAKNPVQYLKEANRANH